ncbi:MAG: rhombosortase [Planctomycetes bacterium]|nr:rhombosortase [Planctomycetota bacterium]
MAPVAVAQSRAFRGTEGRRVGWRDRIRTVSPDLWILAVLLLVLNAHLWGSGAAERLIFLPDAVAAGEWWRLVTHPFVHASWWHLALDGAAFALAYRGLGSAPRARRLAWTAACGAGSLLAALLFSPIVFARGLCGLSGIAHGMTVLNGLEIARTGGEDRTLRRMGLACAALVVGKSIIEAVRGDILFASLHLGSVGVPIAVCHAGGVLGGLCAWLVVSRRPRVVPGHVLNHAPTSVKIFARTSSTTSDGATHMRRA